MPKIQLESYLGKYPVIILGNIHIFILDNGKKNEMLLILLKGPSINDVYNLGGEGGKHLTTKTR